MNRMQDAYAQIIASTGEDLAREGIVDTPKRAAKAFAHLTEGYQQNVQDVVNQAIFDSPNREMVIVQNIEFYSLCEHHLLPFYGHAHVAYLPNGKVLGLSKVARIVDLFAKRLQIQESLTQQIAQAVMDVTGARGAAVMMEAQHFCMMMRGVNKQDSSTKTMSMLGEFSQNAQARLEFLQAVKL